MTLRMLEAPAATLTAEARGDVVEHERGTGTDGPARAAGLRLGLGAELGCEDVERAARAGRGPEGRRAGMDVRFTTEALEAMLDSARRLRAAQARGDEIYGLTTGFGPLVQFRADARASAQGEGLIAHLGAGWGPPAPAVVARATMVLRAHTVGMGCSGITPGAADALLDLIRHGVTPAVPEVGSVGASGDLIPMSHVARVMMGSGRVLGPDGTVQEAGAALAACGLKPVELPGRDALALVNGTAFMTAYAALAVARAERLLLLAERLTGWLYRLLGCRSAALDARLHHARGHDNQGRSAANIRAEAEGHGAYEDTTRPLQEVYSLRCAAQVLGACRDNLDHARRLTEREIAGVSDNPVVAGTEDSPCVLHGGNFQGQQIAFAADAANAACVQAAVLAERQLDVLVNPELNGGGPLLLAWKPGATSGLAGAQLTATAIVAEMRHHGGPCATASIPTNGRNQDVVSMGTMAARQAHGQTERLAGVLAATAIGAAQLNFLRERGRATGRTTPRPAWMPEVEGLVEDRALHDDLARVARTFAEQGCAWGRAG